ncbi:GntR family transcriptional regulator [Paenibacillaceae bacterium]|nr:GntR family transcriptional regulator [Paenibacillaceae bacterium]
MSENEPKYKQLKQEIMSWIASAQFGPHDRLPSENEVAVRFSMSRQTVRQAFGELEQEGYLYRLQGKGTFVSNGQAPERSSSSHGITVGLITTYISDYIFPTIVRGVESALRASGTRLLLASTDNEKEKERESLASMLIQPLDGLLIEPTKSAEGNPNYKFFLALEAKGIPYVMMNERYSDVDAPCLKLDDEAGGYGAADHLIQLGHRKIVGLFKTDDYQGVHRMRGFRRAHREHQLVLDPECLICYTTEEKEHKPQQLFAALLDQEDTVRPTAVVCYNDELAVKLLDIIRSRQLEIPAHISIVGFDDSNLAVATEVKLTTMTHPKSDMGERAVKMLLEMIEARAEGRRPSVSDVIYEPELVLRESTRRPL